MPRALPVLVVVIAAGCDAEPNWLTPAEDAPRQAPAATRFDPAQAGTVAGRATWPGPPPTAPDFLFGTPRPDGSFESRMMPNPNRPAVDPSSRAVVGAVVFLRGVDPAAAKPWDLPPVRVEWRDRQVVVRQGDGEPGRAGFVRRGDEVVLASADPVYHVLRGRGADFFSLTFPEAGRSLPRRFDRSGRVELSSGTGLYWARADLFVCDHPYYTLTDRDGRFRFDHVPAGPVEVVAWLPGWLPARQERDPETGLVTRMTYSDPVEAGRPVAVEAGRVAPADLVLR
ncbi:MAG: carboxypeptidase-like regulatory domain-containing protein [Gemmataceae bacterium]|nr:carboxypeptidase-like regulatory domain-containing protein [Gemmataceae bacterium]